MRNNHLMFDWWKFMIFLMSRANYYISFTVAVGCVINSRWPSDVNVCETSAILFRPQCVKQGCFMSGFIVFLSCSYHHLVNVEESWLFLDSLKVVTGLCHYHTCMKTLVPEASISDMDKWLHGPELCGMQLLIPASRYLLMTPKSSYVIMGHISWGPLYQQGLILIPTWINNHIHYAVWDEIIYPFQRYIVKVWEWINTFILHFTGYVITNPCWN